MTTTTVPFAELRQILKQLGYSERSTDTAHVFHRAKADLLIFRRYQDLDPVTAIDLKCTRRFLDAWGLLKEADFDALLERVPKSA